MGGGCTKYHKRKQHRRTQKHFNNRVRPSPSSDLSSDDLQNQNLTVDCLVGASEPVDRWITAEELDSASRDVPSQGDNKRDEKVIIDGLRMQRTEEEDTFLTEFNNFLIEDPIADENTQTNERVHKLILQDISPKKREVQSKSHVNPRHLSPKTKNDKIKVSKDILSHGDCLEVQNSNANSRRVVQVAECNSAQPQAVHDGKENVTDNSCKLKDNTVDAQGTIDMQVSSVTDALNVEEKPNETSPYPLDSLFFFPLKEESASIPHRLPDRLQVKPRKRILTYDERMLLADLNRYEQLDKRRQFAIKQNRSITRNGKSSKIDGNTPNVSPDESFNHSVDSWDEGEL